MSRIITKKEITNHLHGTLAMVDGTLEIGHSGGMRRKDMQEALPHELANRIMELLVLLEDCDLLGDSALSKN